MKHRSMTKTVTSDQILALLIFFGIHYLGRQHGPIKNAYLCLRMAPYQGKEAHPLLRGFVGAQQIFNGISWVDVVFFYSIG